MKNFKNIFKIIFVLFLLCLGNNALAEVVEGNIGGTNSAAGEDCFANYKYGSVHIVVSPKKLNNKTGENVQFDVNLTNNNKYPIIKGGLYVQIYRSDLSDNRLNHGDYQVDEFFAANDISLEPGEMKKVSFDWGVPKGLSSGMYTIGASFLSNNKFDVSGLGFVHGAYATAVNFGINNEQSPFETVILKDVISLNGQKYIQKGANPAFNEKEKIEIKYKIKNTSNREQTVTLNTKLFSWSNLDSEYLINKESQKITLKPKEEKDFSASWEKLDPNVYTYEISTNNYFSKSVAKIRFIVDGENTLGRTNFLALSKYPIKKGDQFYFFNCFHAMSDSKSLKGKMVLSLKDKNGSVITSQEYVGDISPQLLSKKIDFVANNNYDILVLESKIYDEKGKEISKESLRYDCQNMKSPSSINLDVKDNIILAKPVNICSEPVESEIGLEIRDSQENLVYQKNEIKTKELKQKFNFLDGQVYQIMAYSGLISNKMNYEYKANLGKTGLSNQTVIYIIIILIVMIAIGLFLKNKKSYE